MLNVVLNVTLDVRHVQELEIINVIHVKMDTNFQAQLVTRTMLVNPSILEVL
jgi:hypothetical protein